MVERYTVTYESGITSVDFRNLYQREVFFAFFGRTDYTFYYVTGLQTE